MEIDIKCMECNRQTRNFELGKLFYVLEKPTIRTLIENQNTCPKCKHDLSNKRFMIKESDLMLSLLTTGICQKINDMPPHLEGTFRIDEKEYNSIKGKCKSVPNLVEKF